MRHTTLLTFGLLALALAGANFFVKSAYAENPTVYGNKQAKLRIVELIDDEDPRVALMAAKEVLDRAYGKPKMIEDDDGGDRKNVTINIVRYADDKPAEQLAAPTVSVRTLALP